VDGVEDEVLCGVVVVDSEAVITRELCRVADVGGVDVCAGEVDGEVHRAIHPEVTSDSDIAVFAIGVHRPQIPRGQVDGGAVHAVHLRQVETGAGRPGRPCAAGRPCGAGRSCRAALVEVDRTLGHAALAAADSGGGADHPQGTTRLLVAAVDHAC